METQPVKRTAPLTAALVVAAILGTALGGAEASGLRSDGRRAVEKAGADAVALGFGDGAPALPEAVGGVEGAAPAEESLNESEAPLPEGSFRGTTPLVKAPDVMALLLRKDPANKDSYYAVLAEYDRTTGLLSPERLALTKWIPRMYAYRVDKLSDRVYAMRPLRVSAAGDIVVDGRAGADSLTLARPGTLEGAVLARATGPSGVAAETITFDGKLGSTWENYVAGNFFGTTDSSGGDYFGDGVNTVLSKDGVAVFSQEHIKGEFAVSERAPGMFTFRARRSDNKGNEKVVTRIGVFVDIVNWKPFFTTNELLLINPDDPRDVGFYYERH